MKTLSHLILCFLFVTAHARSQDHDTDPFRMQKKTFELSTGIHMRYIEAGSGDIAVLFLHGYTDTSRSFQTVIDKLLQINSNVRVIAPDLRGHGDTTLPNPSLCKSNPEKCFSPELFARDVIELLDKLKIQKVFVVGHSMGGVITQELAAAYPDRVSGIVLISTFVNGKQSSVLHDFLIGEVVDKNWRTAFESKGDRQWPYDAYFQTPQVLGKDAEDFIRGTWVSESNADPAYLEAIAYETMRTPLATWVGVIHALGKIDNTEKLSNCQAPALVLWSSGDVLVTLSDQQQLMKALGKAQRKNHIAVEYKTYGNVSASKEQLHEQPGHNFHWTLANEVAADIADFIRKHPMVQR